MNDQSEIIIGENGDRESIKTEKYDNNENDNINQQDTQILQELRQEEVEEIVMSQQQIQVENNDIVEKDSNEQVQSPTLQVAQTRNIKDQNSGSFRRKTKKELMIEPIPVFDCMYCVQNERFIMYKQQEIQLHKKYSHMGKQYYGQRNKDIDNSFIKNLIGNYFAQVNNNNNIKVDEGQEEIDNEQFLRSQLALQIMINSNPHLKQNLEEELDEIEDFSPIQRKPSSNTIQNYSSFIPFPQIQVERSAFDQKKCYIKIKIAQIQSEIRRKSQSIENNYATSPTFIHNDLNANTLLFQTLKDKQQKQQDQSLQLNEIKSTDPIINLEDMLDEPIFQKVTIHKWARNRRQKVINDISFDSEVHNIYEPKFSSENGDESLNISLLEEEEIKVTHDQSDDSNMSIAEERDTISNVGNAVSPNLSRIINNNCSISKMEKNNLIGVINKHYTQNSQQRQGRSTQPPNKQNNDVYAYQVRSYAESVLTIDRGTSGQDSNISNQQSLRPRSFMKQESISSISSFVQNMSIQNSNVQNQLYVQLLKPFLNRQKQKVKLKSKRNDINNTGYINQPQKLLVSSQNNISQNNNIIYKSYVGPNDTNTSNSINPYSSLYNTPMNDRYKKQQFFGPVKKDAISKTKAKQLLKNSQSHSHLTIEPKTFITRNVKIRKSNVEMKDKFDSPSPLLFNPKPPLKSDNKKLLEPQKSPTSKPSENKLDFRMQNKRQKLARDILLSKVYTSGQVLPQAISQHKKNNSINTHFDQIRSSGQLSKLSLQFSKQKSTLQLDPLNKLQKTKQSMQNLPLTTKSSYKNPIEQVKMPAINNYIK